MSIARACIDGTVARLCHTMRLTRPGTIGIRAWPGLATLAILFIDGVLDWSGRGLLVAALADETAHLLTALLILAAVPSRIPPVTVGSALLAVVLIDLDHLPLVLGSDFLTQRTGRPVTHALWVVMLALILAAMTRDQIRAIFIGVGVGLVAHFIRDLAGTSAGVPLLWPLSTRGATIPYGLYLALLLASWGKIGLRDRSPPDPQSSVVTSHDSWDTNLRLR